MNRKSRGLVLVPPFGQEEVWGCTWSAQADMAGTRQAGSGAMLTKSVFTCGAGRSLQDLNGMTPSDLKTIQEHVSPHPSISRRGLCGCLPAISSRRQMIGQGHTAHGRGLETQVFCRAPFLSHFSSRVLSWLLTSRSAPCPLDFSLLSTSETVRVTYRPHPR